MKKCITFIILFFMILILYLYIFIRYNEKADDCTVLMKMNEIPQSIACYEEIPFFMCPNVKIELFRLYTDQIFGVSNPAKAMSYLSFFSLEEKRKIIKDALIYGNPKPEVRDYLNKALESMESP